MSAQCHIQIGHRFVGHTVLCSFTKEVLSYLSPQIGCYFMFQIVYCLASQIDRCLESHVEFSIFLHLDVNRISK